MGNKTRARARHNRIAERCASGGARQFILPLNRELIVDLFAGGGGASLGIEQAVGRHVDIAVNHDAKAVALHQANHPQTRHFVSDVFEVDPLVVTDGRPVGLLWASPDCKHFSKAKGAKPVSKRVRGLAWVVVKWARLVRPRIICLENVEEFQSWGPLLDNNMPCPERKGKTFQRWVAQLRNLGYHVEWRELRACDFGAPTIRKRLFLVARCDGQPIEWPQYTHGGDRIPYRTAAECIDWSIPCPSIFLTKEQGRAIGVKRPLAEATQRRIAHGIKRYVLEAKRPFIVPLTHGGDNRVHTLDGPLRTITTARRGELALSVPHITKFNAGSVGTSVELPLPTVVAGNFRKRPGTGGAMGIIAPTLVQTGYGERPGQAPRVPGLDKPLGTCVDGQKHGLVAAYLAKHYGGHTTPGIALVRPVDTITTQDHHALVASQLVGVGGPAYQGKPRPTDKPARTVTTENHSALAVSHLAKLRGTCNSADVAEPLGTVTAGGWHHAEVRALLIKFYGTQQDPRLEEPLHTVTTRDRFGVVTVEGDDYVIADIGMRMLQPRELFRAQGFPDTYVIDRGADGAALTKDEQVRMVGNSVCPPVASAIVRANYVEAEALRAA